MAEQHLLKLVFIPYPGVGHLASMVEFAKLLLHRHSTLSVSFLITTSPATSSTVTNYTNSVISSSSSDLTSRINLLILPNLDDNSSPPKFDPISIMDSRKPQLKQAVSDELTNSDPPRRLAGLVLDMFCTSMLDVADELGVPSFIYYISTASSLGFFFHMQSLYDHDNYDILASSESDDAGEQFLSFPTYSNPVPRKVFPLLGKDGGAMFNRMTRDFRKTKGILVNTVKELEPHATDTLSRGEYPKVYPVGPILNLKSGTWASSASHDDVIGWLDKQPESSVVFLCFGSLGAFCGEQVKEIAHALERTGERFLWSLRRPTGEGAHLSNPKDYDDFGEVLPEGFLDRTADVGRVIGWAPQTAVLAHKATGGFVSHCGSNSMLESLWFGVPMATWPMYADHQLSAFLLVKELGIATEISMDYQQLSGGDNIIKADDIERGIRNLMAKDCIWKKKLKEVSDKTKEAITDGGSSSSSIAEFLATL